MKINTKKYPTPRVRHHTNPQWYLPLSQINVPDLDYFSYPPTPTSLAWDVLFADGKPPRFLDLGCGRGSFMLSLAEANPKANVMGLEVRDTTVDYINSIIAGEKIQNAHAMWYSVANGLPFIASESIESVFYFFPDPWVKTRHSKRRAFTSELLQEIVRILQPSGSLFLATDVPEVDAYQQKLLARTGLFSIEEINGQENWFPFATDHEAFCIRKGIPYKRLNCRMMKSSRTNKL